MTGVTVWDVSGQPNKTKVAMLDVIPGELTPTSEVNLFVFPEDAPDNITMRLNIIADGVSSDTDRVWFELSSETIAQKNCMPVTHEQFPCTGGDWCRTEFYEPYSLFGDVTGQSVYGFAPEGCHLYLDEVAALRITLVHADRVQTAVFSIALKFMIATPSPTALPTPVPTVMTT
eukprot:CAMPEP_0198657970 /NCGR_PEP_ID=MMETSP1467-20131203/21378_1 /TAXON_ID=1462469 /ORGANISM="unid. sp., Strain CCMP2135" /LENGTH=173 /DNA_ID=CAMNT_0044394207 /DNA_START=19 /DNA_END=540 /DNA_ORIENTATION=-